MDGRIADVLKAARQMSLQLRAGLLIEVRKVRDELAGLVEAYRLLNIELLNPEAVSTTIAELERFIIHLEDSDFSPTRAVVVMPEQCPSDGATTSSAIGMLDEETALQEQWEKSGEGHSQALFSEATPSQQNEPAVQEDVAAPHEATEDETSIEAALSEETAETPPAQPESSAPPAAQGRKKALMTHAKYSQTLSDFLNQTKPLTEVQTAALHDVLHWKHLACQARALLLVARDLGEDESLIRRELDCVSAALRRTAGRKGEFFAFNKLRDYPVNHWTDVALAFCGANAAARLVTLLEKDSDLFKSSERQRILMACRAAFDWICSRVYEITKVNDASIRELGVRICNVEKTLSANADTMRERTPKGQKRQVTYVIENVSDWEKTIAQRRIKHESEEDLANASSQGDIAAMTSALAKALERGVPPSDKVLLDTAERVRSMGGTIDDERVLRFLEERSNKGTTKQAPKIEEIDPERERLRNALVPYTRGKTVFILSGKTKSEHATKLKDELELAEVLWPDVEKDSKVSALRKYVHRCDFMLFNPNFSRHRYKELVDSAEEAGKPCVVLDHGYGVTQMMARLHDELKDRGLLL